MADVEALPGRHRSARARGVLRDRARACSPALRTPFSGRIQIVGKSPLTGTLGRLELRRQRVQPPAPRRLRRAASSRGKAAEPTLLVIRDGEVLFEPAGELWGQEIPATFDALQGRATAASATSACQRDRPGRREAARIASVMNDRYHAFGRQGFGAIYGSKNLKAIVVARQRRGADRAIPTTFKALCKDITTQYKRDTRPVVRFFVWLTQAEALAGLAVPLDGARVGASCSRRPRRCASCGRSAARPRRSRCRSRTATRRSRTGRASARATSRSRPEGMKLDGADVDKYITKKLSCGDCPMPCKGIVKVKSRNLSDVRRPDYETIVGFGANLLNDDIELVTACHDACNRYGIDAVSSSRRSAGCASASSKACSTRRRPRRHRHALGQRRGRARAHDQDGQGRGLRRVARQRRQARRRARRQGQRASSRSTSTAASPRITTARFTSLMGVTYIADPTPGRHTAGSASWNETFGAKFPLPKAADAEGLEREVEGHRGQGRGAGATTRNAHQAMNGLGLCMFTLLTGALPWPDLTNARPAGSSPRRTCSSAASASRTCAPRSTAARASGPPTSRRIRACSAKATATSTAGPLKGVRVPLLDAARRLLRSDALERRDRPRSRSARADELGMSRAARGLRRRMSSGLRAASSMVGCGRAARHPRPRPDQGPHRRRLAGRRRARCACPPAPRSAALSSTPTPRGIPLREALDKSPHLADTMMLNGERCPFDEQPDARARRRRRDLPARAARRRLAGRRARSSDQLGAAPE